MAKEYSVVSIPRETVRALQQANAIEGWSFDNSLTFEAFYNTRDEAEAFKKHRESEEPDLIFSIQTLPSR